MGIVGREDTMSTGGEAVGWRKHLEKKVLP